MKVHMEDEYFPLHGPNLQAKASLFVLFAFYLAHARIHTSSKTGVIREGLDCSRDH